MRVCTTCDGVIAKCPICGRAHCDDACRPVSCQLDDNEARDMETIPFRPLDDDSEEEW